MVYPIYAVKAAPSRGGLDFLGIAPAKGSCTSRLFDDSLTDIRYNIP